MEWIAELPEGALVVTANNRLARGLREAHDALQAGKGLQVWPSADILPYPAWLRRCWREAQQRGLSPASERVLLSAAQERLVWEQAVAAHPASGEVLRPNGAAASAAQAWALLKEWQLPEAALNQPGAEARVFAVWRRTVLARCAAEGWVTEAELPALLAPLLAQRALPLPGYMHLAGFDWAQESTAAEDAERPMPPAQRSLWAACVKAGCRVSADPTTTSTPTAQSTVAHAAVLSFADQAAELDAVARWARHWLEAEEESRIGIVVPDLAAVQTPLARLLGETLTPALRFPAWRTQPLPYNFSLAGNLAEHDVVSDALALLRLTPRAQPLEDWSRVLLSPFIGGSGVESGARAALDADLRERGDLRVSAATVVYYAGPPKPKAAEEPTPEPLLPRIPVLHSMLGAWSSCYKLLPARRAPSEWTGDFAALLTAWGWPGPRTQDSAEHQAVEKWEDLLEQFAALDLVQAPLPFSEAVNLLARLAEETDFQPEAARSRVQVLGLLEASGLQFEHLWVLGLHDEVWPSMPRPNAFLSVEVQRAHHLPHTSARWELDLARTLRARLLSAAPAPLFSHPEREGDRDLRASPLLADLPQGSPAALPQAPQATWQGLLYAASRDGAGQSLALESLVDWQGPALPGDERASGGVSLFRDQSDCPFRAFAKHRLKARALALPQPGLDPGAAGTLVHAILQRFWSETGTHKALLALNDDELRPRLGACIATELAELGRPRSETVTPAFQALERRRLEPLLFDFLVLERNRAPFAVLKTEHPVDVTCGGLQLSGKVDRIDQMEEGGALLLIDYKTGQTRVADWFGERPADAQMPLYATSSTAQDLGPVQGLLFAGLRRGNLAYEGLADNEDWVPGVAAFEGFGIGRPKEPVGSREEVFEGWRAELSRLGAAFAAGDARVDRRAPTVCTYCELAALCRIQELAPGPSELPEGQAEGEDGSGFSAKGAGA